MSAAESRVHSLETQLDVAKRRIATQEREYEGRRAVLMEKMAHQKSIYESRIMSLERELDAVCHRKAKLILEMCDMEERLIEQAKEIKTLRSHLKWKEEPSSVA